MTAVVQPRHRLYRYEPETDIHIIDCGGEVDLATGVARLRALQLELAARPSSRGVARLLIDFRHTIWKDESVHMELAKLTRAELLNPDNSGVRAAILNTDRSGGASTNEHWFTSEADAVKWLTEQ